MSEQQRSRPELSIPKVVATALAAATAAVIGSFVSAAGTVIAAAAASVITTVGGNLYQRSLERTRDTVRSRITARQHAIPTRAPLEPMTPSETPPADTSVRRRRWAFVAAGTVAAFVVGVGVATAVEFAHGAPLSGGVQGTSVGSLLGEPTGPVRSTGPSAPSETSTPSSEPSASTSATPTSSTTPTTTSAPRETSTPTSSARSTSGVLPVPTAGPTPSGLSTGG